MTQTKRATSSVQAWVTAARPRTLALAVASILLGNFLAAADGTFRWSVAVLAILTAILLQILSNLANDYGDAKHGVDSAARIGPQRAVQSGQISGRDMKRAIALVAATVGVSGLALVWVAFGAQALLWIAIFLLLGAAAIWAAIAYTASDNPYGYVGLGDLFVFLFFGWVATAGSYFLQTRAFDFSALLPATSAGLFAVAVLNVNNIRDVASDRETGKRSIPVRLGVAKARRYHWFLLMGGFLAALVYVLLHLSSPWQFLFVVTLPLLIQNGRAVSRRDPQKLDPMLRQLSVTTLLFVVTLGIGLMVG